jgi:DNA-binding LacI/PurR family transcriptional regulator
MSDLIALAALKEINAIGLKIPEDISVVGFDSIDETNRSNPPLITVHQNSAEKSLNFSLTELQILF